MSDCLIEDQARIIIWFFRDKCNEILMGAFKDGIQDRGFPDENWVDVFDEAVADCRRLSYVVRDQLSKLYGE